METIVLNKRLTHRFVGSYMHLDSWKHVGYAKLTPPKIVEHPKDFDDGGTYIRWATFPKNQNLDDSIKAVQDVLTRVGCHHDYDCCGCESHYTLVIHRHKRRAVFLTRSYFNY